MTATTSRARDTFVARFGEDQAQAVERAARDHLAAGGGKGDDIMPHDKDNRGSDEFRYWFLSAIGHQCVSNPESRQAHGVTADIDQMKVWANDQSQGDLAGHDGDPADWQGLLTGAFDGWLDIERMAKLNGVDLQSLLADPKLN